MTRHIIFFFLLSVITLFFLTQNGGNQNKYLKDYKFINRSVRCLNTPENIDSLIEFGLYNLAFESLIKNKQNFNDSVKISIAFKFAENGEFDKGFELIKLVDQAKNRFSFLNFSLFCNLKKENLFRSEQLFDSLKKYNARPANICNQAEFVLSEAYLEHNKKNYTKSISLNETAILYIKKNCLPEKFLAISYRRLGNDYNDIVRNKINFPLSKNQCCQKGLYFYRKELQILLRDRKPNRTKIALNYITTAMLLNEILPKKQIIYYYQKALKLLIVSSKNKFIITTNPVYASLASCNLGDVYLFLGDKKKMNIYYNKNKDILDTRSFYRIKNKQSLDVWVYFRQISNERKIQYEHENTPNNFNCAKNVLNLSTNCKYNNQYLQKSIEKEFGTASRVAIKNWILFNELLVFASYQNRHKKMSLLNLKIQKYKSSFNSINAQRTVVLDSLKIEKISKWCLQNDVTIIDYQLIFGGGMSIIKIDKHGISLHWVDKLQLVTNTDIECLRNSLCNDEITTFQKVSYTICQKLLLQEIQTKNIIICPDEYLEKIPFDALLSKQNNSKQWSKINYIGKTKHISLIPNFASLTTNGTQKALLQINIWSSKSDNFNLPFNDQLIKTLEEKFVVLKNNKEPKNILHILGHTYRSRENNIEFRLDKDTLSVNSNGFISPKLAILEGCSSGEGKIYKFEGAISQTRCFLYNGTPSVIYSIWDADNESSTKLFKLFYDYLDEGLSSSLALNKAKNNLISDQLHPEWANPFYWANFQYTGKELSFFH